MESFVADGGNGVGYGDGCQAAAILESRAANGGDGVGNGDGNKLSFIHKRTVFYGHRRIGDNNNRICAHISCQMSFCRIGKNKTIIDNAVHGQSIPWCTCGSA